jgi:class 3 adenylate cyclase/tetratricopeptide (TPR) repeat protein
VLFADLSGSTTLAERLDPEELRQILARLFEALSTVVRRYDGTVDKYAGDAIMAVFGAPLAHEDDAGRAVAAALAMRSAVLQLSAELAKSHGIELALRIGINTGDVVAGPLSGAGPAAYTVVGDTVNTAQRLEAAASPGEIVIGAKTRDLVAHAFVTEAVAPVRAKGKTAPIAAYRVLRPRERAPLGPTTEERLVSRGLHSAWVGRAEQEETINAAIAGVAEGRGATLYIVGEAGLGKSRLLLKARRRASGVLWLEGRSLSISRAIGYWPFLEMLRMWAGLSQEDDERSAYAKLRDAVTATLGTETDSVLPYLATLLDLPVPDDLVDRIRYLDAEATGRQVFRSFRLFIEAIARERPLVLVLEDWHWADTSSVALARHLVPLVTQVPLLLCFAARPDSAAPGDQMRAELAAAPPGRHREVELSPLTAQESDELVRNLLGLERLPAQLGSLVIRQAEGNPFYVEEIVQALIDMGAIAQANGSWQVTARVDHVTIPDSVEGVIIARIDRLGGEVKEILRIAAVVGRSFLYRILSSMAEAQRELDRHLGTLQHLELIREKARLPEIEYFFKHALVQEAVYEGISLRRRRSLHRQVAASVETLFRERLDEFYGLLAYHYARAEDWPKAQDYLFKAAERAERVAADAEALEHYRSALAAYERAFGDRWDPVRRAGLERRMGQALYRRGEHDRARDHLERGLAILGEPFPSGRWGVRGAILRELLWQLLHRAFPRFFIGRRRGEVARLEELNRLYEAMGWIVYFTDTERLILVALRVVNTAEDADLLAPTVVGLFGMGITADLVPAFRLGRYYYERAAAIADRSAHPVAIGYGHFGLQHHYLLVGEWDRSITERERSASAFWESGELRRWAVTSWLRSWVLCARGDLADAEAAAREVVRVADGAGDRHALGWGLQVLGRALRQLGRTAEAAETLRRAIGILREIPDYQTLVTALGELAYCEISDGRASEAVPLVEEADRLMRERGLLGFLSTIPRLARAATCLVCVETAPLEERDRRLKEAAKACRAALAQGRWDSTALAPAERYQGTLEWLRGRHRRALERWQKSLDHAERLGARYERALTLLEIAQRSEGTGARDSMDERESTSV